MECFTADFLQFFTKKPQNLALGLAAGYLPSNSSISGIFLSCLATREATRTFTFW